MSSKQWAGIIVVLGAVALGLGLFGRTRTPAAGVAAPAPVPVSVARAERGDLELSLKVVGRAEAWSSVSIRAQVEGRLARLAFTPGARVRKGELLAELDPALLKAALDQARGTSAKSRAEWRKAEADAARYRDLVAKGFVSRSEAEIYQANLAIAKADVEADSAAEELAATRLAYARVSAPFDAIAGAPLVWPGAQIVAGSTDIVVLNQVEPIRVAFAVPEQSLAALRRAFAQGAVAVRATVPGDARAAFDGRLDFIDNAVDPRTGTITLKARFDNADLRLTPGQFVRVALPTEHLVDVVSVPVAALQSSARGSFVFVVEDGKAVQRFVTPGASSGARTVISAGLAGGEQVVTEGQMLLVDGSRVSVRPEQAP